MSKELPHIAPSPQPEFEEVFAVHQTVREFYHEVNTRSDFKKHCEWYYLSNRSPKPSRLS